MVYWPFAPVLYTSTLYYDTLLFRSSTNKYFVFMVASLRRWRLSTRYAINRSAATFPSLVQPWSLCTHTLLHVDGALMFGWVGRGHWGSVTHGAYKCVPGSSLQIRTIDRGVEIPHEGAFCGRCWHIIIHLFVCSLCLTVRFNRDGVLLRQG